MKILIVQLGHLGDMVLTTPMFAAIKRAYPWARIDVLASHRNAHIAESHPMVSRVLVYRKRFFSSVLLAWYLRSEHYDWWIDPKDHVSRESRLWCRIAAARQTVGFNTPGGDAKIFQYTVPGSEDNDAALQYPMHCIERNLQALSPLGITITHNAGNTNVPIRPILTISVDARQFVEAWIEMHRPTSVVIARSSNTLRVVCNLSAGSPNRYWLQEYWIETVGYLVAMYDCEVVLLFVPSDKHIAEKIHAEVPQALIFPSRSIDDAIALIACANMVISPDTSVVHIASAFDVPCIALFHSLWWNAYKFAPRSSLSWVVQPASSSSDFIADVPFEAVIRCIDEWASGNTTNSITAL
jgi:ADP-heptose:LPS heptosyltransferase